MSASPHPLTAGEMEPLALWFRLTLDRAVNLRDRQDHGAADYLVTSMNRVFRLMRDHGAEHGYSPDILFGDVRRALDQWEAP